MPAWNFSGESLTYLPGHFLAWGKFLLGASTVSRPPLQVSPGFQFRPVPPLFSVRRGAARGYCGPPSCRSSRGQPSDPGIAFSCARWRAECPPVGRLVGTGHRWGGRGRPSPEAESQACWDPAAGESGDQPRPVPHPHAQLPLQGRPKDRSVLRQHEIFIKSTYVQWSKQIKKWLITWSTSEITFLFCWCNRGHVGEEKY